MAKRNSKTVFALAAFAAFSSVAAVDSRVEFRDCPKCDKRIKIDLAANKAYVNLSKLEGTPREAMAARALKLLEAATIPAAKDPKIRPLMGWSSWNAFGVDISESIILDVARTIATNGLKKAGYLYVNIDDGFFAGHGPDGYLRFHPTRFPNGMKPVVDGIHAVGLRAGIYSDAGEDTCGSMWAGSGTGGKDLAGIGSGLYGHDAEDCKLHFIDLGFDFIKVDYCGASKLKLNEKVRYTEIANAIKATGRTDVRLNLCRWAFPGTWAADIAESWRTTKDIRANWQTVKELIEENLYLNAYAKPGHYNDMDMLEVGVLKGSVKTIFGNHGDTGLTPEEERTHFGIWCILSSPLLIGCDVRSMPASTMQLITNPYLLGMNQNDLGLQASVAEREGEACILVKDAGVKFGTSRYVALYNGSDKEHEFTVRSAVLDLDGRVDAFDLVEMADVGCFTQTVSVKVPPHGAKFYRFDAERRLQRKVYEAESAFLTDYHELYDPVKAGIAFPAPCALASGGMIVTNLGGRASNDLIWPEVKIDRAGRYLLSFFCLSPENGSFDVEVDGRKAGTVAVGAAKGRLVEAKLTLALTAGVHRLRLSNATSRLPAIDRLEINPPAAGKGGVAANEFRIRDPFVLADGGRYYLYESKPWSGGKGVAVRISDDLETWTEKAPVMTLPADVKVTAVWAPEVHKFNGKYYLFATITEEKGVRPVKAMGDGVDGKNLVPRGTWVFVADRPTGPFVPVKKGPVPPADFQTLDGTLYVEDGQPYMVYCHEWCQMGNGTIEYAPLTPDFSAFAASPKTLLDARSAMPGAGHVTDGPFFVRSGKSGKLYLIWSNMIKGKGYCVLVRSSSSGKIAGPWSKDEILYGENGGHAMLFRDKANRLRLSLHQPNRSPDERMKIFSVLDDGESLKLSDR